MTLSRIRELREKRAKAVADAQALIPADGTGITTENRQKFDGFMADADTLKAEIDRLERLAVAQEDVTRTAPPPEAQPGAQPGTDGARALATTDPDRHAQLVKRYIEKGEDALSASDRQTMSAFIERDKRHRVAFRDYLRRGLADMSAENRAVLQEFRDMGVGTGNLGGYFVPQGFVYDVEQALKYYGNMLGISQIMDTATGNPLPYPTDNDTTNMGAIVGEGSQVNTQDVSIGHIVFGAYKFTTNMVKVSLELLQDSAFDMEGYLKQKFAIRLGRILNNKFTIGAGTTEPTGVLTAATAGPTAIGSSGNTGGAETGGTSIGYIDLVNLEHSIDPLYRRGAKFVFHDSTLKKIKEILDKYGRPLWVPGVATNAPDTILGYEYSINNDMPTIAVNAKTVLFGPFDKYLIRRVKELAVLRLVERFADYGQVAFLGFARYDGNLLDAGTHPIQYLVQAAS
jgi:HK97 family phage major capsid protein